MNKIKVIVGISFSTILLFSCGTTENNEKKEVKSELKEEVPSNSKINEISIEKIDEIRLEIESLSITPLELATTDLREKIKQKWSKIHFYVENDVVVKIKTYPHSEISKRTEEFYSNKDGLLLVVIEDNGEGDKGKEKSEIDKMYYFNGTKFIKEINKEQNSEFTIKESDAEELLSEFNEYIDIYKSKFLPDSIN